MTPTARPPADALLLLGRGDPIGDDDEAAQKAASHDLLRRMAELIRPTIE